MGLIRFVAFSLLGVGIGWGWGWVKALAISNDPSWETAAPYLTTIVWVFALVFLSSLLFSWLGHPGRAWGLALWVWTLLSCVTADLTCQYRTWLAEQPPTMPAIVTNPIAWWSRTSDKTLQFQASSRRGTTTYEMPRWGVVLLQLGITGLATGKYFATPDDGD